MGIPSRRVAIVYNNVLTGSTGYSHQLYEEDGPGRFNWLTGWPGYDAIHSSYSWNNTHDGVEKHPSVNSNSTDFIEHDRDFFKYTASFDGSSGMGMGLFSARPSSGLHTAAGYTDAWLAANWPNDRGGRHHPGGGVGYWATDTQKLYKAASATTWEEIYSPLVYPHPLRGEDPVVPPETVPVMRQGVRLSFG